MYSAVVLGWPTTTIIPSRETSTPTEIMLVASTRSMPSVIEPEPGLGLLRLTSTRKRWGSKSWSRTSRRSAAPTREVSSTMSGCHHIRLRVPSGRSNSDREARGEEAAAVPFDAAQAVLQLIRRDAVHAGELADRGEVADRCHPGIGRIDPTRWNRRLGLIPLVLSRRHHRAE